VFGNFLLRGAVIGAVILACAIGLIAAFGLVVVAVYFAFEIILPPVWAALAAAGTALLFCALAVIIGVVILKSMRKRARRRMQSRIAAAVAELFGGELGSLADRHPARALGLAVAAGFAVGFSPALRRALFSFLRR
jgi:hypothetical protein